MARNKTFHVPLGRLGDLQKRSDAHLLAYTIGLAWDAPYKVTRYNSRDALIKFCKYGSRHHALVKDVVPAHMLVNPNVEREGRL